MDKPTQEMVYGVFVELADVKPDSVVARTAATRSRVSDAKESKTDPKSSVGDEAKASTRRKRKITTSDDEHEEEGDADFIPRTDARREDMESAAAPLRRSSRLASR